jgi:hypothetical protein
MDGKRAMRNLNRYHEVDVTARMGFWRDEPAVPHADTPSSSGQPQPDRPDPPVVLRSEDGMVTAGA